MAKPKRYQLESIDDVLEAVRKGRLDRRTRQARAVEEVKACLEVRPTDTVRAMLRHTIALNHLIERELVDFAATNQGELLDSNGRLPDALSKDLLAMQKATLAAMKQLLELEGKGGGKSVVDVADIILDRGE